MSASEGMGVLGSAARAVDPLHDPRWDKLATGELSDEELHAFEAELHATEAGRRAWELLAPPSHGAHEANVDGLLARVSRDHRAHEPVRARATRRRVAAALLLAAALAAVVVVLWPKGPSDLPSYRMETSSELAPLWGSDTVHLKRGSSVSIVLRPSHSHARPIRLEATIAPDGGSDTRWAAAEARAIIEGGAVKITGTREALFGGSASGGYAITLTVSPRDGGAERRLTGRVFLDP